MVLGNRTFILKAREYAFFYFSNSNSVDGKIYFYDTVSFKRKQNLENAVAVFVVHTYIYIYIYVRILSEASWGEGGEGMRDVHTKSFSKLSDKTKSREFTTAMTS